MIEIELCETGAPRGERNLWYIKVNGKNISEAYGQRCPKALADLYADLCTALKAERAPYGEKYTVEDNVPQGWKLVPEAITEGMVDAAYKAHYGVKRVNEAGGSRGMSMTVDGIDYDGFDAMQRFWKGALKAVPKR